MALFEEDTPIIQEDENVNPVKVRSYPEVYRGIAVDTKYTPSSSMLTWINGSNWSVNYYSQILDSTQEPTPLALNRKAPYQQYRKIVGIDLKVTQALDPSQDDKLKTFSVTGGGFTYPFLTPNDGDMFTANIGDGKVGLFTITSAKRTTYKKDSIYAVEWKMISELTNEQLDNLDEKSTVVYYYSQGSLLSGCGPFITEQEHEDSKNFSKLLRELTRRYLSDFFSVEHHTLLVPDQENKTYDHFLTKAVMMTMDGRSEPRIRKVKMLNVMSEPVMSQPTIWDAIIRQDITRFCDNTERAFIVSTRISRWRPELQAIGYSGIPSMVYPIDSPTDVDSQYDSEVMMKPGGKPFKPGKVRRQVGKFINQKNRDPIYFRRNVDSLEAWNIPADIHPVVKDNYYIFTEAFYHNVPLLQSKLEMLVHQLLNNEKLNQDQLRAVTKHCLTWDNLERFYYHPVLIMLLKYSLR